GPRSRPRTPTPCSWATRPSSGRSRRSLAPWPRQEGTRRARRARRGRREHEEDLSPRPLRTLGVLCVIPLSSCLSYPRASCYDHGPVKALVVGTHNEHKLREIRDILLRLPVLLRPLPREIPAVVEDAPTLTENAI